MSAILPGQAIPVEATNESLDLGYYDAQLMARFTHYRNLCVAARAVICVDCRCAVEAQTQPNIAGYVASVGKDNAVSLAKSLIAMFEAWGVEA